MKSSLALDESASYDPGNDSLTHKWTAPAGIILNRENTATSTFIAPVVSGEVNYIFYLVVNDGSQDSPADEMIVLVKFLNFPPKVVCNYITENLDSRGRYMLTSSDLSALAAGTKDVKDSFKKLRITAKPTSYSCNYLGCIIVSRPS